MVFKSLHWLDFCNLVDEQCMLSPSSPSISLADMSFSNPMIHRFVLVWSFFFIPPFFFFSLISWHAISSLWILINLMFKLCFANRFMVRTEIWLWITFQSFRLNVAHLVNTPCNLYLTCLSVSQFFFSKRNSS